ncbi:hypothetical protein [Hydrogenoanaerobacterium sp.]|uniref:hypothetical protein n=1 Tax=Hydrogenoanaerobacterium sp. TaxID=2953763 RepID=UPI002899F1D3|nr:hypothetical protein [Hydrogenoanaerobacterium sp.]
MKTVSNLNELITNIQTLDGYLNAQVDPEYDFALNLIKNGTCFVAMEDSSVYRFYPSRFIGYADNSMDAHLNNVEKDGKETNPAISRILGAKPSVNSILNKEYARYCETLGFEPRYKGAFGSERKFWVIEK